MDLIVSNDDLMVPRSSDSTLLLPQDSNMDELQGTSSSENSNSGENAGENTGRWTAEEHRLFLQGLEQHGKGWKKIASLIKSRTVVQIRTHAQKYFQKLAKSKQGGDDTEHGVGGNNAGGSSSSSGHHHSSTHSGRHAGNNNGTTRLPVNGDTASTSLDSKRRRNILSGTKRKAISSVVASAIRERKKAVSEKSLDSDLIQGIAPTLVPFVKMTRVSFSSSEDTSITTLSSSVLEESLFRFLTPHPGYPNQPTTTTGAVTNAPRTKSTLSETGKDEGIHDPLSFPTWIWADFKAEPSSWYERAGDVDELLNDADALDWLADTGDLNETYEPTSTQKKGDVPSHLSEPSLLSLPMCDPMPINATGLLAAPLFQSTSNAIALPAPPPLKMISSTNIMGIGSLPSLSSSASLFAASTDNVDPSYNFPIFEAPFDEQAFVTSLLENPGESFNNLSTF